MIKYLVAIFIFKSTLFSEQILVQIDASSYNDWVYYSFFTHSIVVVNDPETSLGWDIAFQRYHIKTNSGTSGSGNGGAYVDSLNLWNSYSFQSLNDIPENSFFEADTFVRTFYDLETHEMSWGSSSRALDSWGNIDTENNYTMVITNNQLIVRSASGNSFVKIWPYDYYSDSGVSGHISVLYDTDIYCNHGIDDLGVCGGDSYLNNHNFTIPINNSLSKIYPNPFNSNTTVQYFLEKPSHVIIAIYNLRGRHLYELVNSYVYEGENSAYWDAKIYPSGFYFISIHIDGKLKDYKKVTLLK